MRSGVSTGGAEDVTVGGAWSWGILAESEDERWDGMFGEIRLFK